jgi:hypothetical protein
MRQSCNIGLNPNWNACLAEARGEFIVFVSDDDFVHPTMIEHCVALIRQVPTLPLVVGLSDVYFVSEDRTSPATPNDRLSTGVIPGTAVLAEFLKERISAPMCSIMLRTEALRRIGGFPIDLDYAGDTIVWTSLLLTGEVGFVNESCAAVSTHADNETSRLSLDVRLTCLRSTTEMLVTRLRDAVNEPGQLSKMISGARCYAARNSIKLLASCREQGAGLRYVWSTLVGLRAYLWHLRPSDLHALSRPLAIILLPAWLTRGIRAVLRRLKPAAAYKASTSGGDVPVEMGR